MFVRVPPSDLARTVTLLSTLTQLRLMLGVMGEVNLVFSVFGRSVAGVAAFEETLGRRLPWLEHVESLLLLRSVKRMGWVLDEQGRRTDRLVVPAVGRARRTAIAPAEVIRCRTWRVRPDVPARTADRGASYEMGALRTPREKWIDEGLRVLAEGGVDAVRVEVLAKRLGVTKGGFYGYFQDRQALLTEMLDTWEREAVDEVIDRVQAEGGDLLDQVRTAGRLTFSNDRLLPVDLAIRTWARRDPEVAERLRRVDNRRIQLSRDAISTFCDDPDEVEARALLAYCVAIGSHFLAADHPRRTRLEVINHAADLILDQGGRGHLR